MDRYTMAMNYNKTFGWKFHVEDDEIRKSRMMGNEYLKINCS